VVLLVSTVHYFHDIGISSSALGTIKIVGVAIRVLPLPNSLTTWLLQMLEWLFQFSQWHDFCYIDISSSELGNIKNKGVAIEIMLISNLNPEIVQTE
jgi:hypothetical protein